MKPLNLLALLSGLLIPLVLTSLAHSADQCGVVTQSPNVGSGWFTGSPTGTPKYYVTGTFQTFANCDNYLASGVLQIITPPNIVTGDYYKIGSSGELLTYDHCYSNVYALRSYTIDATANYTGECAPPEPVECSDGIVSGDEEGFDCGGSCLSECGCPAGSEAITIPGETLPTGRCAFYESGLAGNCPTDYLPVQSGAVEGEECYQLAGDFGLMYAVGSEPTITPSPGFTGGTFNVIEDTSVSEVDNGDGTKTVTTTTTSTSGSGTSESTSTTTTTETINTTTNTVISSNTTTSENTAPDTNPENYSWDGVDTNIYDGDISADLPVKDDISGIWDSFINNSPLFSILDTFEVQTSGAVCSVDLGTIYDRQIVMDVCQWQSHLTTIGTLFLSIIQGYALLVIYRGWK